MATVMVVAAIAATTITGCSAQSDQYRIIDASDGETTLSWVGEVEPVAEVSADEVRIELCGSITWPLEDDGRIGEPTTSDSPCSDAESSARAWLETEGFSGGTWSRDFDMVVLNAEPRLLVLELAGSS